AANQPIKNRPIRTVQSPSKTAKSFGAVECSQTKRIAGVMLSPLRNTLCIHPWSSVKAFMPPQGTASAENIAPCNVHVCNQKAGRTNLTVGAVNL
ncbi:hypothetical protein, partial [Xanthomonas hortorum]